MRPEIKKVVVPPFFKCPISLELMRDPVVLSTGQSYDRSSIEPWLEAGNHTCPATMQTLSSLELVPNHTLRRLIQNWCEAHGSLGMVRIPTPKVPVGAETVALMLQEVQTSVDPLHTLKNMRSLARDSDRNRKCIEESDAVSVIASLISAVELPICQCSPMLEEPMLSPLDQAGDRRKPAAHRFPSLEACEEALAVLALLEVGANKNRRELLTPRSITAIAWFLCKGSLEAKVNAATIIAGIASERESQSSIGAIPGVLETLTKLLREDLYPKATRASLKAMLTICIPRRNRIKLVEGGVVPLLIELLPDTTTAAAAAATSRASRRSNVELALGVLELLCSTAEGRAAVTDHALAMAALVHHLHTVSALSTELSVAILWWVCKAAATSASASAAACLVAAQQSGAFAALLLLLQLDCSPRTRVKARELLKLLRNTWMLMMNTTTVTKNSSSCDLSSQLGTITAFT